MQTVLQVATALGAAGLAAGQFPPTPEGQTVLKSKNHEGVTISYKEPGICETTEGVKSYAGHVHLPPGLLDDVGIEQDYPVNTFFWFFESREDPENAPLSIWMNGGPGSSSMIGLLQENGPCIINDDSNSTELNPWSWNNKVNMLYIDQPNQVGFSYDTPTNGTFDQASGLLSLTDFPDGVPEQNNTFYVGTFPSQNPEYAANNTMNAARSMWHFAQVWFQEFPGYKPEDDRISIWTESYGGRYGPAFTSYFQEQNEKIANGTSDDEADSYYIHLDTLGIINGCIDLQAQSLSYPQFAYNNTYGIETINETVYNEAVNAYNKPNGCKDRINHCRDIASEGDPNFHGNNRTVNEVCHDASDYCSNNVEGPFLEHSGRGYYDIAHPDLDPFPKEYFVGYLNQHWVQAALGVPTNFTTSVNSVYAGFTENGDYARSDVRGYLEDIAYILDSGIKVALVYGDRDYACNWIGGEKVSLEVEYSDSSSFRDAGYADIQTNSSYVGGQVRQYGNFSFSRVYQAGHEVPAYQPDTAYEIFHRAMFNYDIATGEISTTENEDYATEGSSTTFQVSNDVPEYPEPTCYILSFSATCNVDQMKSVLDGSAYIHNYIVTDPDSTSPDDPSSPTSSDGANPTETGAGSTIELSTSLITLSMVLGLGVFL
ncbi:hypothetical protein FQN54_007561 [Arachnomyces sp. PD_36]|nr:hypothetical protein FQN54_007561 [Arachnomyces sp. PD_36]